MAQKETYVTVSFPKSLADKIDKILKSKGYASRTEFIKDGARRLLELKK